MRAARFLIRQAFDVDDSTLGVNPKPGMLAPRF
jgi:hypothetical protein